jgi:hypothetical protein
MSERPPLALKKDADQLADLIASNQNLDDNERTILEKKLGFLEEHTSRVESDASAQVSSISKQEERVGIWKAGVKDGKKFFSRDPKYHSFYSLWANTQNIPPKSEKFRVLLLGESVARGFLYDPYFNPAKCLSEILNTELYTSGVEVIDIAKTNILMDELKQVCESSLLLQPDAVVIFAGNNWLDFRNLSDDDADQIIKILQSGESHKTLKPYFEEKLKNIVIDFLKHISALLMGKNIPIIMIIPEFNLMDWKNNSTGNILLNPKGETEIRRWLELKKEIEQILAFGDTSEVEPLIHEMISLNESNPRGYELMAQHKLKTNQLADARCYLELAVDTSIVFQISVPCIVSIIRKTLREELSRNRISIVDLPAEFNRYLSGGIPGKELFLDYCHLTDEGIQISMALVAQTLINLVKNEDIPLEKLKNISQPTDDVKATAHLFAAIHNAHNGQPYENLYYHCLKSVNLSSSLTDIFIQYAEMATRNIPWSISKNCEAIVASGKISQYPALIQSSDQPILDLELVKAMVNALKTKGIDIENTINTLRMSEHGLQNRKIDLTKSYYHNTSYYYAPIVTKGYFKSYEPESAFFLIAKDSADVALNLTCRASGIDTHDAEISIMVNGVSTPDLDLTISKKWKTFSLQLPRTLIKSGVNKIIIKWPLNLDFKKNQRNKSILHNKRSLILEMLYPAYGEIHMFSASMVKETR